MERYDPQQDKWHNVANLNIPRSGACAVVLMGQIFVMGGGSDVRKILNSCEIYDPAVDRWFIGKGESYQLSFFQGLTTGISLIRVGETPGGYSLQWPTRGCSSRKGYLSQVSDERVGISLVEVLERVGRSVISVLKRTKKG